MTLQFNKTRDVATPRYGTDEAAGIDFFVPNDFDTLTLKHGESAFIASGIRCVIKPGFSLIAFNKSGVALKKHLNVGACVVDSDYRGEVHLHVFNWSHDDVTIKAGEKLVQFVYLATPQIRIETISDNEFNRHIGTTRGTGGFGSTGSHC